MGKFLQLNDKTLQLHIIPFHYSSHPYTHGSKHAIWAPNGFNIHVIGHYSTEQEKECIINAYDEQWHCKLNRQHLIPLNEGYLIFQGAQLTNVSKHELISTFNILPRIQHDDAVKIFQEVLSTIIDDHRFSNEKDIEVIPHIHIGVFNTVKGVHISFEKRKLHITSSSLLPTRAPVKQVAIKQKKTVIPGNLKKIPPPNQKISLFSTRNATPPRMKKTVQPSEVESPQITPKTKKKTPPLYQKIAVTRKKPIIKKVIAKKPVTKRHVVKPLKPTTFSDNVPNEIEIKKRKHSAESIMKSYTAKRNLRTKQQKHVSFNMDLIMEPEDIHIDSD
ncbi:hypothetical protein PCE1_004910 [Barthelona sp. PCE]